MKHIQIFDTSLRDGSQAPGCGLYMEEKIRLAKYLAEIGTDVIEAGFPISSNVEFESVSEIAKIFNNSGPIITAFSRVNKMDIERSWESVKYAKYKRVHLGVGSSNIHIKNKLKISRDELVEKITDSIKFASQYDWEIQFYAEDSTRSEFNFLDELLPIVVENGATIINLPDTTGCASSEEYYNLVNHVKNLLSSKNISISAHCHDDLGLGCANALAAIKAGADQVECTLNGIGERCGNTSFEEVILNLNENKEFKDKFSHSIDSSKLFNACSFAADLMNLDIPPNKALTGRNSFATEAGTHADGILKSSNTYLFFDPSKYGRQEEIVLGARSGKATLKWKLEELGFKLNNFEDFEKFYNGFLKMADLNLKKRGIDDQKFENFALSYGLKKE
tara:strand:+ start:144 stop:1319 length:1176 start_codon:yes stop_codon:yes gene_type:complete